MRKQTDPRDHIAAVGDDDEPFDPFTGMRGRHGVYVHYVVQ